MTEILTTAFAVFAIAAATGALPWPPAWQRRKPLACDVCMVLWAFVAFTAALWAVDGGPWPLGAVGTVAAYGGAVLLLRTYRWMAPTPILPLEVVDR